MMVWRNESCSKTVWVIRNAIQGRASLFFIPHIIFIICFLFHNEQPLNDQAHLPRRVAAKFPNVPARRVRCSASLGNLRIVDSPKRVGFALELLPVKVIA